MRENILDKRRYEVSRLMEITEIILISLGLFLIPLLIPQFFGTNSQYIIGTIVNCSLIVAGINIKGKKKLIGLVTLPSVAALTSGLVLNAASIYTVYMIPIVWLGNLAIIYSYRYLLVERNKKYMYASLVAILLKAGIIFLGFNTLVAVGTIPGGSKVASVLFTAMGVNQLITAICGSLLAFLILKLGYERKTM